MELPYDLDPGFERALVYLACCRPKFFGTIGYAVDPDLLAEEPAQIALKAANAINGEVGRGPSSLRVVLQRCRQWMESGRLKMKDLEAIDDLFTSVEEAGVPEEEEVIAELKPILRERLERDGVHKAMKAVQNREDLGDAMKTFEKAKNVGNVDTDIGVIDIPEDYTEIDALKFGARLSYGCSDLDIALGGGQARGTVALIAAQSGGGKTTALCSIGAGASMKGMPVAYATLELSIGEIQTKFRGASTNLPLNDIMMDPETRAVCTRKLNESGRGPVLYKKFPARKTHWEHIVEWYYQVSECLGTKPVVLIVDFLGKMGFPVPTKSSYEWQGIVMDEMHEFAQQEYIWLLTASQPQRGKRDRKVIGIDDLNDSQGKIEGADLFMSLNSREEGREIYYWIGKHRAGPSETGAGPFPHAFANGRLFPPHFEKSEPMATSQDDIWDRAAK